MKSSTFISGALALASSTYAVQNATYCTDSNKICYVVNVPESTASNGGNGDLYFQISGPSTMRWIGFGQGDQMAGANMFVIYANSAGTNVTLSPRHGITEVEPLLDQTTNVTLLAGSGISNGQMVANVLCTSCNMWTGGGSMDFDNTNAGFIWSYQAGSPLLSDSTSATITQHDLMGNANFDLATAAGGDSSNPFVTTTGASVPSTGSGSSAGGSGSGNSGKGDDGRSPGGGRGPGSNPSSSGSPGFPGSTGASGGESTIGSSHFDMILKAHGIIGPVAFAVLFPLGAIMIRALSFPGLVYLHAAWQAIALILSLATLGLGVWLANQLDYLHKSHAIIGIVAIAAVIIQPFTGLAHHLIYRSRGISPNLATYPHVWWGRAAVTLGIINGGLGLQLANDSHIGTTHGGVIAYGVVAGVMWVLWMLTVVFAFFRGPRNGNVANTRFGGKGSAESNSDRTRHTSGGEESPSVVDGGRREMRYK